MRRRYIQDVRRLVQNETFFASADQLSNRFSMLKKLLLGCLVAFLWLQYGLWFGQSGYFAQQRLADVLQQQSARVAVLKQRNKLLTAEVHAVKQGEGVVEARARRDLGLIKPGEVFYLVPDS